MYTWFFLYNHRYSYNYTYIIIYIYIFVITQICISRTFPYRIHTYIYNLMQTWRLVRQPSGPWLAASTRPTPTSLRLRRRHYLRPPPSSRRGRRGAQITPVEPFENRKNIYLLSGYVKIAIKKLPFKMVISHSYVSLPEGIYLSIHPSIHPSIRLSDYPSIHHTHKTLYNIYTVCIYLYTYIL